MRITEFNTVVDDNGKKYLVDEWLDTIEKGDYNKKWIEYNEEEKKYTVHEIFYDGEKVKELLLPDNIDLDVKRRLINIVETIRFTKNAEQIYERVYKEGKFPPNITECNIFHNELLKHINVNQEKIDSMTCALHGSFFSIALFFGSMAGELYIVKMDLPEPIIFLSIIPIFALGIASMALGLEGNNKSKMNELKDEIKVSNNDLARLESYRIPLERRNEEEDNIKKYEEELNKEIGTTIVELEKLTEDRNVYDTLYLIISDYIESRDQINKEFEDINLIGKDKKLISLCNAKIEEIRSFKEQIKNGIIQPCHVLS